MNGPSSVVAEDSSVGVDHFAGVLADPRVRQRAVALDDRAIETVVIRNIAGDVNDFFTVRLVEANDGPTQRAALFHPQNRGRSMRNIL